ncbi:tripartite motif-containing protein 43C-like isoform X2 [Dysidea avara]|uniref:tripartite motif-containing protein 43C-like isoform X2 n=1 Tax=Dysidea avara TaxID=196820 RepID=UPI00332564B7
MPSASSQANDIGGYTYQFVDPPEDRLQCVICHFMCRDPQLTQCCGHSCCKSCLEEWKRTNSSHACPTCRRRRVKTVAHHEADRTIKDLRVYCSNNSDHRYQEDAATTRDQINSIQQTLDVNISRQVNVKMDELIKSLQAKVEVDVSSVCELPKYNIKEIRHQLELLKDKVKDKELSQATRLRRLSDEILNQIRLIESKVMSSVPLLNEQCQQDVEEMQHQIEEVLDRLDFIETLNITRDIDITEHLSEMVEVNSDQSQLLHREPSSDEAYHNMTGSNVSWSQTLHQLSSHDNQIAPVIVKMNNVSEKINNKETWYSEPFFAFKRGYKMCLKIVCSRDKLSVSLYLMKGPYDDDIEPEQSGHLALRGTFTIELLNQLSDVKNVQAKKYYYMRGNISYQNNWLTEFDKSLLTNDYFIHDSVYFRVDCDCVC